MGFQTFDSIIDESYDLAKHPYDRIQRLIHSLNELYTSPDRNTLINKLYELAQSNIGRYAEYLSR